MRELVETLAAWQADGVDVGRAVVLRTYGSAPRAAGSVLLAASDGRICGSVSGGCVEAAAAQEIDRARATGQTRVVKYGVSDEQAWSVGLACGSTIDVLVEPDVPAEALDAARGGSGTVVITPLPAGDGTTHRVRLTYAASGAAGLQGSTGSAGGDAELVAAADEALLRGTSRVIESNGRAYFLEAFPVRPRLIVVGAVEIARSLVRLAKELGFETVVIDGRAAFATPERFPDADELLIGWADELADQMGLSRDDSVVVLSHDPKFDEPAVIEALGRGCRYVGAIGSKKTQAERRERLRDSGMSDEDLARLHGPIGLDLGGRSTAETALAIMAEVVATRYGATGVQLSERSAAAAVPASG